MNRDDDRRRLIAWADPGYGSPLESIGRYDLLEAGYAVRTQRVLEPAGRVDSLLDHLVVELDGYEFHADRQRFAEDRRRDTELARRGFTVLRFTWDQVVHHRARWSRVVHGTHRGWRGAGPAQGARRRADGVGCAHPSRRSCGPATS